MAIQYVLLFCFIPLCRVHSVAIKNDVASAKTKRSSIPGAVLAMRNVINIEDGPYSLPGPDQEICLEHSSQWTCPAGWTVIRDQQGTTCVKAERRLQSYDEGTEACKQYGAIHLTVKSEARQKSLYDYFLTETLINDPIWIGLRKGHPYEYEKLRWSDGSNWLYRRSWKGARGSLSTLQDYSTGCIRLAASNQRWELTKCRLSAAVVCEKNSTCSSPWFGKGCNYQAHCQGQSHENSISKCNYGCKPGWMGQKCCNKKEKAEVSFHCMKMSSNMGHVLLKIDPKRVPYDSLQPVTKDLTSVEWGIPTSFQQQNGTFTLKLNVPLNEEIETDTATEKIGNTYRWHLLLQEKKGFRLPFDRHFVVECNFNQAENMSRKTELEASSKTDALTEETVQSLRERVLLQVVAPDTGLLLDSKPIGTNALLRIELDKSSGLSAHGVSPYDCQVSSEDGKQKQSITDHDGCALASSPVSKLTGVNGTLSSEPFPLFSFLNESSLVFQCRFDFCFSSGDPICDDRCQTMTAGSRVKREAVRMSGDKTVSARIKIPSQT